VSERSRKREHARKLSRTEKEVKIPSVKAADYRRRIELEKNDAAWLRYFFCDVFTYDFTAQQQIMIEAIGTAIEHGGDQAIAASRGEGKSTLFETLLLKYVLAGRIKFALLCAATGSKADDSLKSVKDALEDSGDYQGTRTAERLERHYPEVCVPVRALEGAPQRAFGMIVSGRRRDKTAYTCHPCKFTWCGDQVIMPLVPGSPSSGAIIATAGLEREVRGMKKGRKRPDVIGIDDPDTEETVNSPEQAMKLETRIERGLARIGGQRRRVARIMLTTLQRKGCVSARFTDPQIKPAWQGRRFRFLVSPPERTDLWEEYLSLMRADLQAIDQHGQQTDRYARRAHAFYIANREAMDRGAVVANPNRFYGDMLPDGTQQEVSALQHYYNQIIVMGSREAVETEYDNSPPEEDRQTSGIVPSRVQSRVSGLPWRQIPLHTIRLTQGIDVGKRWLHWVVRAWVLAPGQPVATGHTIDYGETPTRGTVAGSEEGVDEAIKRALCEREEQIDRDPYCTAGGEVLDLDLTLIDCQYRMEAIYEYCSDAGLFLIRSRGGNGRYSPSAGVGRSNGTIREDWQQVAIATDEVIPGDFWKMSKQANGIWQTRIHADSWKCWEHDRWSGDQAAPGGLCVWGEGPTADDLAGGRLSYSQRMHRQPFPSGLPGFADQICAEVEAEEIKAGMPIRRWVSGDGLSAKNNHLFDAAYRADVAASMLGVPLLGRRIVAAAKPRRKVALTGRSV
jgi:hypothetical protein